MAQVSSLIAVATGSSGTSTRTFTSHSIGAAPSAGNDRYVVVFPVAADAGTSSFSLSSATIAGNTANVVGSVFDTSSGRAHTSCAWYGPINSGTTATTALTFTADPVSGGSGDIHLIIFTIVIPDTDPAPDVDNWTSDVAPAPSATVAVPAGSSTFVAAAWDNRTEIDFTLNSSPSGFTQTSSIVLNAGADREALGACKDYASADASEAWATTLFGLENESVLMVVTFAPGSQAVAPTLFSNTNTFYTPAITTGAVNASPSLFSNTNTFYATSTGRVITNAAVATNEVTFHTPTVSTAAASLGPSLYTNATTFPTPTVSALYALTPAKYTSSATFHAPAVTSQVTLTPALFTDSDTFHTASISGAADLTPALFTNSQTFRTHGVSDSFDLTQFDVFDNTNTFYTPDIARGTVGATAPLVTNSSVIYSHTVAAYNTLAPSSDYANQNVFLTPRITTGVVDIAPNQYTSSTNFYTAAARPIELFPENRREIEVRWSPNDFTVER